MSGYGRNAELSRAVILAAAGAALIGLNQQALGGGSAGVAVMILGGVGVVLGLVLAVRALIKRQGGADQ